MARRAYDLMTLVAAGVVAAGSLPAQQLASLKGAGDTASVSRAVAPSGSAAAATRSSTAAPSASVAPAVPVGRRAEVARVYDLQRENRALTAQVADADHEEQRLVRHLDSLKAQAHQYELDIAAIDRATAAARAERQRLEARVRLLESLAAIDADTPRVAARNVPGSPLAPAHVDSAHGSLAIPPARLDAAPGAAARRDSGAVAPRPLAIAPRSGHLPLLFYSGLTAGLVAVQAFHLDADPGGYHDALNTKSLFPDKAVHALAAWAVTSLGADLHVGPWRSAAAVCAAGVGFELAQGYVSRYDIGANCIGAAGAAAWRTWLDRR
jgi:hypothetical protein